MRLKRVLISLMLSLAMVFTALPAMAFAEPAVAEDTSKTEWVDKLWEQIDSAQRILNMVGDMDEEEFRMASMMAINWAKSNCQKLLDQAFAMLSDIFDANSEDIRAFCKDMAAAITTLQTAWNEKQPKIQNYLKLASKTKGVKVKVVRKKKYTFVTIKPVTPNGEKKYDGKMTYTGKFLNKKSKRALKFSKKTGKITVKKGTKKGTYKIKVTAKAGGDDNYKPLTLTKTIKIKVR